MCHQRRPGESGGEHWRGRSRARIPLLLDACQSTGQMPLDVTELNIDMMSVTSRKFLRGPRGIGFVYVREEMIEQLEPPFLDNHAATWTSRDATACATMRGASRTGSATSPPKLPWALRSTMRSIGDSMSSRRRDHARRHAAATPSLDRRRARAGPGQPAVRHRPFTAADTAPVDVVRGLAERGISARVSRTTSTRLDMQARGLDALVRAGVHYYTARKRSSALPQPSRRSVASSASPASTALVSPMSIPNVQW